jgi:hypothetical protein
VSSQPAISECNWFVKSNEIVNSLTIVRSMVLRLFFLFFATPARIRLENRDQDESGPNELLGSAASNGIQGGGGAEV